MRFLFKCFLIAAFCFISIELQAQPENKWADSVLNRLKTDSEISHSAKTLSCAKLLDVYHKQKNFCRWIEAAILQSRYFSSIGKNLEALTLLNTCDNYYARNLCHSKNLVPELYLAYGALYTVQNDNNKARYYSQKGIDINLAQNGNRIILAKLFNSMASTFDEADSQIVYYQKAYKISVEEKDLEMQGISLNELGYVYANLEDRNKAIFNFREALLIAKKRNAIHILSGLYNNLAGLAENDAQILLFLDSAKYFAKLKGNLEDLQTAYQNASFYYYERGDFKNAFDNLTESNVFRDSLFNRDKINAIAEMEEKYQSELKVKQIKLLNEQNKNKSRQRNGLVMGSLLLLLFTFAVVKQRNKVRKEKLRSDNLLLNILPEEVAEELKTKGYAEAKQFDEVTVLFTDFKDFTQISEKMTPNELVEELNTFFKEFDNIITQLNIEKIKTIGDSYMCVGGLPKASPNHAEDVVKAGIAIQNFVEKHSNKRVIEGKEPLLIRIGIHSGPVIAGIVGVKKYAYDIWGDTVNTASRMESSGEAGKVNISETTYALVKDKFHCTPRGKIMAKHKGEMEMYFVEERI